MNYDFDIHSVLPLAAQKKAPREGLEGDLSGQQIALFRDPAVADALRAADPEVQTLFLESGFGLTSWATGLPAGQFRAEDEEARNRAISRFAGNLRASRGALRKKDWGGFSISDFTDGYLRANPISHDAPLPHDTDAQEADDMPRGGMPAAAELSPSTGLRHQVRPRLPRRRLRDAPGRAVLRFVRLSPLQRACAVGAALVAWLLALSIVHLVDHGLGTEVAHAMARMTGPVLGRFPGP